MWFIILQLVIVMISFIKFKKYFFNIFNKDQNWDYEIIISRQLGDIFSIERIKSSFQLALKEQFNFYIRIDKFLIDFKFLYF